MPSVILPAHNESALLGAHLSKLLSGLREDVQVIVACNGCKDDSVGIARKFAPRVQVLDLPVPSKVGALNAADAETGAYPRVYLDADIEIDGASMNRVIQELEQGAIAAEPVPWLDTTGASWCVRQYYRAWQALHGLTPGSVGSGLYGLSEEGRSRFEEFPDVIADDGFVRAHFGPGEIVWVENAASRVRTPRRVGDLVRIKTRSRIGNMELEKRFPKLWAKKRASSSGVGAKAGKIGIRNWPALCVYIPLQWWIRRRAAQKASSQGAYQWERDESSRAPD